MPAQLLVISGPDKGRCFPLVPGQTLQVGRSQTTDTRLTDPTVSRVHFKVAVTDEQSLLRNNSTIGTQVNNQKVEEHVLEAGDIIRIGATQMRYLANDPEASTVAPMGPSTS